MEQTDGGSVLSQLLWEALAIIAREKKIVLGVMKDLFVNPVTFAVDWEFVCSVCARAHWAELI